jgi:hypothetical protein
MVIGVRVPRTLRPAAVTVGNLLVALALLGGMTPRNAMAQGAWAEVNAAGYGVLGLVGSLAMYVGAEGDQGPPAAVPAALTLLSAGLGYGIGSAAERAYREGRSLSPGATFGTRVGTTVFFGTLGFAVGAGLGTGIGGDEGANTGVWAASTLTGLVVGIAVQRAWERRTAAGVTPVVGADPQGRVTLGLRFPTLSPKGGGHRPSR